jgi:hypothetical protein
MLKEASEPTLKFNFLFAFKGFNRAYKFLLCIELVPMSEDTDTGEFSSDGFPRK